MSNDAALMKSRQDMAGTITAAVFILLALLALWDMTTMTDADSYIFPGAVAIVMIIFCAALIIWNLTRPGLGGADVSSGASTPRRVLLVAAMLGCAALMPVIGFLLAGMGAFMAITMIAMYDPWTPFLRVVYPLTCAAIVVAFHTLFTRVLLVPLPVGALFE